MTVNREALWTVLEKRYCLPTKLIRILKGLHQETTEAVRAYGKVSDVFLIKNVVRQGDVLAPILFNLFFDAVICIFLQKPSCRAWIDSFISPSGRVGGEQKANELSDLIPRFGVCR